MKDLNTSSMEFQIISKQFEEMSNHEIYEVLRLRAEVFVVEQKCVYQDLDRLDECSVHLMGLLANELVSYLRITPPGTRFKEASFGRVVTAKAFREKGYSSKLLSNGFQLVDSLYQSKSVRISAQVYLEGYYGSFGFKRVSDVYLEDGIEHVEMLIE